MKTMKKDRYNEVFDDDVKWDACSSERVEEITGGRLVWINNSTICLALEGVSNIVKVAKNDKLNLFVVQTGRLPHTPQKTTKRTVVIFSRDEVIRVRLYGRGADGSPRLEIERDNTKPR